MKEYVELKSGLHSYVYIHTEEENVKTDIRWYSEKVKVLNKFSKDGWKVVGYTDDSILMER